MGRRLQELAECAEDVRPDRVTLVLVQVDANLTLAREDIEVVEPEVDHHFFELALAVRGAQDLGLHQLAKRLAFLPHDLHLVGRHHLAGAGLLRGRVLLRRRHRSVVRRRLLCCLLPLQIAPDRLRRNVVVPGHLRGALRQCFEGREPGDGCTVVDARRLQLLLDVVREADGANTFDITGRGAEAEAIQDVNDGSRVRRLGYRGTSLARRSGTSGNGHDEGDDNGAERETRGCSHELLSRWLPPFL